MTHRKKLPKIVLPVLLLLIGVLAGIIVFSAFLHSTGPAAVLVCVTLIVSLSLFFSVNTTSHR